MNESQAAYTVATLVFAMIAIVASMIGVLCIKESVTERSKDVLAEKQPVKDSIKDLMKNKYFIYLAIGTILYNLTAAPVATYYAKYVFNDVGITALINLPGVLMIFFTSFSSTTYEQVWKKSLYRWRNACISGRTY